MQIGYVVLFAPAFPVSAAIVFFNNLWRLRGDAYLLLYNTQRPPYRCAEDIGSLQQLLQFLAALGVATHVGILVFTSNQLHLLMPFTIFGWTVHKDDRFTLLVVLEHLLLLAQFILQVLLEIMLPKLPKETSVDMARQKHGASPVVEDGDVARAQSIPPSPRSGSLSQEWPERPIDTSQPGHSMAPNPGRLLSDLI